MVTAASLVLTVFFVINGSGAKIVGRIIGGSDAPDYAYPYQVSLRTRHPYEPDFHFCSGSIINERWILTAAHCVETQTVNNAFAVAGTNYLNQDGDEYRIQFWIKHEKFQNFYHYDIALVRIVGKINFNEHVKPIPLANWEFKEEIIPAKFAGWGSTVLNGPAPNNLQELVLNIIPNDYCVLQQTQVTPMHICTFNKFSIGTCHGDSGGPLVVNGYQVGVASYIRPCAVGLPDVFTRVSAYTQWIEDIQDEFSLVFSP